MEKDWVTFFTKEEGVWAVVAGAVVVLFSILWLLRKKPPAPEPKPKPQPQKKKKKKKKKFKPRGNVAKKGEIVIDHPLFVTTFQGNRAEITQIRFSKNGKFFLSTARDKTIRLFPFKALKNKKKLTSRHRIDLGFDHATCADFTRDGRHLVTLVKKDIRIYKFVEQAGGNQTKIDVEMVATWDTSKQHKSDIRQIEVSNDSKFILGVSEDPTVITLWSLTGEVLHTFATRKLKNYGAAIAPSSQLFAVGTFTGDVRVYEIVRAGRGKTEGEFKGVEKIMACPHKLSVFDVDFSTDEKLLVTGCKDNTYKVWDINVQYKREEDPKLLYERKRSGSVQFVKFSPDQKIIAAITSQGTLSFHHAADGKLIDEIHMRMEISGASWDSDGKYFACSSGPHAFLFSCPTI